MPRKPTDNANTDAPRAATRELRARFIRRDATNLDQLKDAFLRIAMARAEKEAEDFHKTSGSPRRDKEDRHERSA